MTGGSLITLPTLLHKNKAIITLTSFTVSLLLLLMTCYLLYGHGGWISIALVSIFLGFSVVFLPFVLRLTPARNPLSMHKATICMLIDTILLFATVFVGIWYEGTYIPIIPRLTVLLAFEVTLPWLFLIIIRYARINRLFKSGICVVIGGAYYFFQNPMIYYGVDGMVKYEPIDMTQWTTPYINGNISVLVFITCIVIGIIFTIAGIIKQFQSE